RRTAGARWSRSGTTASSASRSRRRSEPIGGSTSTASWCAPRRPPGWSWGPPARGRRYPRMGEGAIELTRAHKVFGSRVAVERLDLSVPAGSLYGFIGPNGSGKTTTLRMILRILHPDEGEVRVLGAATGRAADDRTGYLPEERGLYRRMRVREVLRFHARLKGV